MLTRGLPSAPCAVGTAEVKGTVEGVDKWDSGTVAEIAWFRLLSVAKTRKKGSSLYDLHMTQNPLWLAQY